MIKNNQLEMDHKIKKTHLNWSNKKEIQDLVLQFLYQKWT